MVSTSPPPPPREVQRQRRGHAFYPPASLALPPLYANDRTPTRDQIVVAHYFVGRCDWWVTEYDPAECTAFGYACLGDPQCAEWGYTDLRELEPISVQGGLAVVERDLHWAPRRFSEVQHYCR